MIRNYAITTLRHILRHKLHSVINIIGLAIASASLILIGLFIVHEFSYDRFHENADSIYLTVDMTFSRDGSVVAGTSTYLPLGPALAESFPQIKRYSRFLWVTDAVVGFDKTCFAEDLKCVDSTFLEMFTFPLISGNPADVLDDPYSIVMTESTARKYFGDDDPIGRVVDVTLSDVKQQYTVTGIAEDVPVNSSIDFDILIPYKSHPDYSTESNVWNNKSCNTYVEILSHDDLSTIESKSSEFLYREHHPDEPLPDPIQLYSSSLAFMNIKDEHLNLDSRFAGMSFWGTPRLERIYILAGIALLIVAIAAINFTTLSIGKAAGRVSEIGTRKSIGASRRQLAIQFIAEAVVLSMISLLIGIALAEILLPTFSRLSGTSIETNLILNPIALAGVVFSGLFLGVISGIYPALILSRLTPSQAIKRECGLSSKGNVTRILVLLQFSLSVFLIVCAIVISQQMKYIENRDLGIEDEFLISIPTYTGWGTEGDRVLSLLKTKLDDNPSVVSVSGVNYPFGRGYYQAGWPSDGKSRRVFVYKVDPDFINTVGATIKEGRDFSSERTSDITQSIIVNEALVEKFELESPIDTPLDGWGVHVMGDESDPTIIGVVKDIHTSSLHRKIKPCVITLDPRLPLFATLVRIKPGNIRESLLSIENDWREIYPEKPFDYSFVDDNIARQYRRDILWQKVVVYSAIVAVITACLGLFGLSSLSAMKRTKEIGVRKVLGATVPNILSLLSREFLILVVISNTLAWPAAYLVMSEWLSGFAYRADLSPGVFLLSGAIALIIALVSVSYHACFTALRNPTDSLRYE